MNAVRFSRFAVSVFITAATCHAVVVTVGSNNEIRVDNKPFFPIMQWLQNSSSIKTQKAYGINTFLGQGDAVSAKSYCDEAVRQGVYAVPTWKESDVTGAKSSAALLGWVFGDEPDLDGNAIPPSVIKTQYEARKAADPSHLSFLTVTANFYSELKHLPAWMKGDNSYYTQYPLCTDVIGYDFYPIYGWCQPAWVYQVGTSQAEFITKFTGKKKSTFQWIECVKTSGEWCQNSSRGTNDGPYDYEIKAQVWLAIVNGANAIGYFTHSWECPGYSQFCVSDEQIAMLRQVNAQITALTGVLCAPDTAIVPQITLSDPRGGIAVRVKNADSGLYVIAVNVINKAGAGTSQKATIKMPSLNGKVAVYGENRSVTVSNSAITDTFTNKNPVHIYVLPRVTSVVSALPKSNRKNALQMIVGRRGVPVRINLTSDDTKTVAIISSSGSAISTVRSENGIAHWDGVAAPGVYFAYVKGLAEVAKILLRD